MHYIVGRSHARGKWHDHLIKRVSAWVRGFRGELKQLPAVLLNEVIPFQVGRNVKVVENSISDVLAKVIQILQESRYLNRVKRDHA